ncbi:MAG: BatD family protein [Dysgonamonadaceae bacterium]|jgi:hypothetical protein|nr:BatD family protein [Dysgonamonadaceae bacterium]
MNKKIQILCFNLCLFSLYGLPVSAQNAVIKATIDSTQILIGEQTKIRLEIAAAKDSPLQLPLPADTIIKGIEVIETSKIDTIDIGNNRIQLKYDFMVTSFDSALYLMPPFRLIAGNDTAYSNELALKVSTLPVDTESQQFYDIKDVADPEFVLSDYIGYILYPLLGLCLLGGIAYLIYRLKTKKSLIPFKKAEIILPPHVIAIRKLDEIKAQKLWQQGRTKEYHSEITDTLRVYMERRFSIPAMEQTSGEILDKLKEVGDANPVFNPLKQILLLADFVKFAKYQPLPDENELSMMNAYLFINSTKIEEIPEKEENNNSTENSNS